MKEIHERISELRENLGLNQTQFAEYLGLTSAFISTIEAGRSKLTEANIRLICLTFGVHEKWLRTGEGPIFTEDAPGQKQLIKAFKGLTPIGKKTALKIVETLADAEAEQGWNKGVAAPENDIDKE